MATRIVMPQLGESLSEGTIGVWLKQEGEWVKEFEPLLEIETDKLTAEYPSPVTGRLTKITAQEGETVPIGEEIGWIEEEGAESGGVSEPGGEGGVQGAELRDEGGSAEAEKARPAAAGGAARPDISAESTPGADRRYSPAVRKLAAEHGLDASELAQVPGTGQGGRVTRQDVLDWLRERGGERADRGGVAGAASAVPSADAGTEPPGSAGAGSAEAGSPGAGTAEGGSPDVERVPLTAMRRTIAERMVASVQSAPHGWTMVEADVTRLVAFRNREKAAFAEREGVPLTYLSFVIKAVVGALKRVPYMNAAWGGDHIALHRAVHIGVSVGLENGLVVPVIRNADEKSIAALARAVHDLAARARDGKLTYDDLRGGTFTVNNTGAFGSILSVPIINPPEAGILSTEAVVKRPVVVDDAIAIRSMMNLSLSVDHRVVDGVAAGRFLAEVKRSLEAYGPETALW